MIRIRELREANGLQQKELAIDLRVSQPTVSDWESGRKVPSAKSTQKLADYFGVTMDYLLGRDNTKKEPTPVSEDGPSEVPNLHTNIKKARINAGLSQKQVALELGVSAPTVSDWESGKIYPSAKNLIFLARLLNTSVDYLLAFDKKEEPTPENGSGLTENTIFDLPGNVQVLIKGIEPTRPSGKRLEFILYQAGYEPNNVANTLNIDFAYLDAWMKSCTLPPYLVVQRLLDAFQLEPADLLNSEELASYTKERQKYLDRNGPSPEGDGLDP